MIGRRKTLPSGNLGPEGLMHYGGIYYLYSTSMEGRVAVRVQSRDATIVVFS